MYSVMFGLGLAAPGVGLDLASPGLSLELLALTKADAHMLDSLLETCMFPKCSSNIYITCTVNVWLATYLG